MFNQTFGSLTVLTQAPSRFYPERKHGRVYQHEERRWQCRCSACGRVLVLAEAKLKKKTGDCGCSRLRPINPGDQFGKFIIVARESDRFYGEQSKRQEVYRVRCDCGKEETRTKHELDEKSQCRSCLLTGQRNRHYKHGASSGRRKQQAPTPEYRCWKAVKRRCYNRRASNFHNYGGRGIKVCERWRNSFANFLIDMGPKPSPEHSIERHDDNGDYTPGNCIWAVKQEQDWNKRTNHLVTIDGRTQCIAAWLVELKRSRSTYDWRVAHGWTDVEALTTPAGKKRG